MDRERQHLKELFDSFIECVNKRDIKTYYKEFCYGKRKNKRNSILKYIKIYATENEISEYEKAKETISAIKSKKLYTTENYRLNCMSYKYVQDLLKLLFYSDEVLYDYYNSKKIYPRILAEYLERYKENGKINNREEQALRNRINEYDAYYKNSYKEATRKFYDDKSKEYGKRVICETSKLMEDIINSKHSIRIYSDLNGIDHLDVLSRLKRVKKAAPEEYEEFMKIVDENAKKEAKENAILALIMNESVKSGIEEDGYTRPFDIIDYYETTKIGIDAFMKSVKLNITDEKKYLELKIFLRNCLAQNQKKFYLNEEINSRNTIVVNDEKIVIGPEEKAKYVEYLESKNLPINFSSFNALERRHIYKIKKEKEKVKSI